MFRIAIQRLTAEGRKIISYLTAGGALSRDKLFGMGLARTRSNAPSVLALREWEEGDLHALRSTRDPTYLSEVLLAADLTR